MAVCLTLCIFAFALAVGLALTVAVKRSPLDVPDILLAPATGFALIMVLVVPLNSAGVPVNSFALPLGLALLVVSLSVIVVGRRLVAAGRQCGWIAAVLTAAFLLTASPMFSFGLNWFSFSNGDAVNYAMSAERLRVDGVLTPPARANFLTDRNLPQVFYYLNGIMPAERYGVDELLAFEASSSRLDAFRCLMPLLIALHLAGIAAVGALAYRGRYAAASALAAAALVAASALATFGIDYQLLGQAGGLLFLTATITRICRSVASGTWNVLAGGNWLLSALVFSALCEAYPELIPFALVVSCAFFLCQGRSALASHSVFLVLVSCVSVCILGGYVANVVDVLQGRISVGTSSDTGNGLFPFYLVPSGVANLFGLTAIADFPDDPWMSLSIAAGVFLLCLVLAVVVRSVRAREPAGFLAALLLAAFALLFQGQSGFALYKLAMYMQPALAAVIGPAAVAGFMRPKRAALRYCLGIIAVIPVLLSLRTQQEYVAASRAPEQPTSASFIEIPNVSGSGLLTQLARLRAGLSVGNNIISDSFNIELARIEGFFTRNYATIEYPTTDEWGLSYGRGGVPTVLMYDLKRYQYGANLAVDRRVLRFAPHVFRLGAVRTKFVIDHQEKIQENGRLWLHGSSESPFNRSRFGATQVASFSNGTPNVLAFVSSSQGLPYFFEGGPQAIFQLEPDIYFRGRTMSGIGRYMLFEIVNPQPPVRIRIEFTESLRGDGQNLIPPVAVLGRTRVNFPLVGRGAASVVSGVVEPQVIDGHSYVLIDMGTPPTLILTHRPGLMSLWGRNILTDRRRLTAFLRNLSVISGEDETQAVTVFQSFPRDLLAPNAVYSGVYEDGWGSDDFSIDYRAGQDGVVHLRGTVPLVDDPSFQTDVSCYVDGFRVNSQRLTVGEVDVPVITGNGVHHIEWRFSRFQRLPGGDSRPASLLIRSIR